MSVSTEMKGDVAVITLDDGKVNACSYDLLSAFEAEFDKAEQSAKAIVIAGRDGFFSAGFDLKVMRGGDAEAVGKMVTTGASMAVKLFSSDLPIVAAVTGHGYALGAIFMLCCDTAIGEEGDYKYSMNETAIGMTLPPWALEPAKTRLASNYLVNATIQAGAYSPEEGLKAGYISQLAPAGGAVDAAVAFATQMAGYSAAAYAGNKRAIKGEAIEKAKASIATPIAAE